MIAQSARLRWWGERLWLLPLCAGSAIHCLVAGDGDRWSVNAAIAWAGLGVVVAVQPFQSITNYVLGYWRGRNTQRLVASNDEVAVLLSLAHDLRNEPRPWDPGMDRVGFDAPGMQE